MNMEIDKNNFITDKQNQVSPRFAYQANITKKYHQYNQNNQISEIDNFKKFKQQRPKQLKQSRQKIHNSLLQLSNYEIYSENENLNNIHYNNRINIKSTKNFPLQKRNDPQSICRKKNRKNQMCENHFNQQALFYLQLQQDNQNNKIWYCQNCASNLYEQGFQVNLINNSKFESGNRQNIELMEFVNGKINQISFKIYELSDEKFNQKIEQKKNQIQFNFDKMIQNLMKIKKSQLMKVQKIKFKLFQQKILRQNYLDSILKKFQFVKESYQKNMFSKQINHQFYQRLIQQQDKSLQYQDTHITIPDSEFFNSRQIYQKLGEILLFNI